MPTSQLILLAVSVILALIGTVWQMLRSQLHRMEKTSAEAVASIQAELAKLEGRFEQRAKDRNAFDHAWHGEYVITIAAINARLFPLEVKMENAEKDIDKVSHWRHMVADAYLPRGVDAIEGRVSRLEKKVFNGQRDER